MKETKNHGHKLLVWGSIAGVLAVLLVVFFYWHKHNSDSAAQAQATAAKTSSTIPINPDPNYTNPYTGPKGPVSTGTSTSTSQNNCGNLVLSTGSSEGTAGTTYTHIVITNNGAANCTLTGFPIAKMNDTKMIVAATHNAVYTATAVALTANGGKAHVVVGLPNPANFDPSSNKCTDGSMSNLYLTMPTTGNPVVAMQFRTSACPGFTVSAVNPSP